MCLVVSNQELSITVSPSMAIESPIQCNAIQYNVIQLSLMFDSSYKVQNCTADRTVPQLALSPRRCQKNFRVGEFGFWDGFGFGNGTGLDLRVGLEFGGGSSIDFMYFRS